MTAYLCKGCGKPLVPGELRRGDNWHAQCFSDLEVRVRSYRTTPRPPRRIKGPTPTQVVCLEAAAASPTGSVGFTAGDRKGTRVSATDDMERPWITAYSYPEFFLEGRGLLEKGNEPHVYRLTPKGRAMLKVSEP